MRQSLHTTRDIIQNHTQFIKGNVLDAGGGPNAKYRELIRSRADRYVCLDSLAGGNVDVVGDVMNMPFKTAEFDTVVCNQVLEHVSAPQKVVDESYRVLKSGGHAIFTAPFLEPYHADPGDFFRYTDEGLAHMFQKAGFNIVETGHYGGFWAVMSSFIKFSFFDPYKRTTVMRRRVFRYVERFLIWLDMFTNSKRIYSDSYIIAKKT